MKILKYTVVGMMFLTLISCSHNFEKNITKMSEKVDEELVLKEDQKAKFDNFINKVIEFRKTKMESQKNHRAELFGSIKQQLQADEISIEKIIKIHEEKADAKLDNKKNLLEKLVEFHKSLDAEQKIKLAAMVDEYMPKIMKRMNKRSKKGCSKK